MELTSDDIGTAWARGRLDARDGPRQLLFGRMHEDVAIELGAFRPGGRVFCIASAGCTAMALSRRHEVVAADLNPVQIAYARRRFQGDPGGRGAAERLMARAIALSWLVGWSRPRLLEFLDLDAPLEQAAYWRRYLDTGALRLAMNAAFSKTLLGAVYARRFLRVLPRRFGTILRHRLERCVARHPNRRNPYARMLFLGELSDLPPPPEARNIRLVGSDAASCLEGEAPGSFDGFSLSNVRDGASDAYRDRLSAAVRRAAAPGAVAVLRSFAEPVLASRANRAEDDRAALWGTVEVVEAAAL